MTEYADMTHEDIQEYTKIHIKDRLKAENGQKYNSEDVFIAVFKHIDKERKSFCRKHKIKAKSKDIQWILIVPTIWSDKFINKLKQWMIKSGLVDPKTPAQLEIITETDATLTLLQELRQKTMNQDEEKNLQKLSMMMIMVIKIMIMITKKKRSIYPKIIHLKEKYI